MQEDNKFGEEKRDILFEEATPEDLVEAGIMPEALPEPETDGPVELLERGIELMKSAKESATIRSWQKAAAEWWWDCGVWIQENPEA